LQPYRFLRPEHRRVDLQIVDARPVDLLVPSAHRIPAGAVLGVADAAPGGTPALKGNLDRAPHADEQHRQSPELTRARAQNLARNGVGVVVHRVDDDVDAEPAVRRDRLVHGAIQRHDQRFEVGTLTAGP
jgi:hypothetical protein